MKEFIKVTSYEEGVTAYVRASSITALVTRGKGTYLTVLGAEDANHVQETPEEVLQLIEEASQSDIVSSVFNTVTLSPEYVNTGIDHITQEMLRKMKNITV